MWLATAKMVEPQMDDLMVFGFMSAFVALVSWLHREESREFAAMFSISLAGLAVYGFMSGAWPLGIVVAVWAARTSWVCFVERKFSRKLPLRRPPVRVAGNYWHNQSRIERIFGSSSDVN